MLAPESAAGVLFAWKITRPGVITKRWAFITPEVVAFLKSPAAVERDRGDLRFGQQLVARLNAFAAGDRLALMNFDGPDPTFRKLAPVSANVWTMRTTDLRIFGWFPQPENTWVAVLVTPKRDLTLPDGSNDPEKYADRIRRVQAWRTSNGMEEHVAFATEYELPLRLRC
jgi:hypothetical protein